LPAFNNAMLGVLAAGMGEEQDLGPSS
jgi:hypothetical protein